MIVLLKIYINMFLGIANFKFISGRVSRILAFEILRKSGKRVYLQILVNIFSLFCLTYL